MQETKRPSSNYFLTKKELQKQGISASISKIKRYYTRENYEKTKEKQLINDIQKNGRILPNSYFYEKYGVTYYRVEYVRRIINVENRTEQLMTKREYSFPHIIKKKPFKEKETRNRYEESQLNFSGGLCENGV